MQFSVKFVKKFDIGSYVLFFQGLLKISILLSYLITIKVSLPFYFMKEEFRQYRNPVFKRMISRRYVIVIFRLKSYILKTTC